MMSEPKGLRPYAFVLAVQDLVSTADYFQTALGFQQDWADGANWRALSREGVRVMIGYCPDALPVAKLGDHSYFAYLHVDDVDALHRDIVQRGAIVLSPPTDKPWHMREMAIATPDGHRLMIAQVISA
jgi:predicted enzyme related to lactoylglutathione lyase